MQATLPKTLLLNVARRGDLAFALLVVVAVMMMIIPLPTALVDVLIACNIAASTLILLVAFYIKRATDLSSLPTIVLMAALFRIALSITTTRLILLQGDAGETVEAFGTFVIGGNVAVGLIVFLIITVAQFVVMTKGAERVAEVGARFTLDALPGKQMNIDNDLRSGAIDQAEAQRRRSLLERESQFYGAMDGSMKFVKGDAIAGLVVIIINLLGGLTIGVLQRGMSLGEAAARYSLLTVGDGLISQIPALLVSMAAGTVVTRVGGDGDKDVGSAIFGQLSRDPRAFGLVAAVLAALCSRAFPRSSSSCSRPSSPAARGSCCAARPGPLPRRRASRPPPGRSSRASCCGSARISPPPSRRRRSPPTSTASVPTF
jgi:type III secretion protein V